MGIQYSKFLPKHFSISVETKKKKKTKPEMEFRFCLILSLCLMASGLPKKTKTGAKLRAKMERLDSMEVKQKRMKSDSAYFPVRLINNGVVNVKSGLLEVFIGGEWGTVCDDYEDGTCTTKNQPNNNVGLVVCRMLGLSGGQVVNFSNGQFGQFDADPIKVENVLCKGDEATLAECRMTWGGRDSDYCGHNEDLGIICDD